MHAPRIASGYVGRALLLGYVLFCLIYLGSYQLRLGTPLALQRGAFDLAIPLLPWTIWLYLSQFLLLPLALFNARSDVDRSRLYYAALLATVLAAAVFLLFPTQLERPLLPQQGITSHAWALLFASDVDGNCFPSLHAALALLAGMALWRRGWKVTAALWPAFIAASTLTTKQHVVWDTLAGLLLGVFVWMLTPRLFRYD
ncbi:MAG: phosphatase PAP2 family protein [Rhodanobacteraceae bacterium]|nr:phosphatase PAP2 family protein [Rhodanobacteraceae bacterium]